MKPYDLFTLIKDTKYKSAGLDVDYQLMVLEGRPVLMFQESTTQQDWKSNFDFPVTVYREQENKLKAHRGFVKAWKSANDLIMAEFYNLVKDYKTTPLITGWSFGGAMCVLAVEDFFYRTGLKCDVISFGAPMVAGNRRTAKFIKSCCNSCTEYAQHNDVVALCPPFSWYHHIGEKKIGSRFNLIKVFKPGDYHTDYDNKSLYEE